MPFRHWHRCMLSCHTFNWGATCQLLSQLMHGRTQQWLTEVHRANSISCSCYLSSLQSRGSCFRSKCVSGDVRGPLAGACGMGGL